MGKGFRQQGKDLDSGGSDGRSYTKCYRVVVEVGCTVRVREA